MIDRPNEGFDTKCEARPREHFTGSALDRVSDMRSHPAQMLALALAVLVGAAAAFSPGPIQYGSVYMNSSGPTVGHVRLVLSPLTLRAACAWVDRYDGSGIRKL